MDNEETIRNQLKDGVSIDDVCRKHSLTFKQLIDILRFYDNPVRTRTHRKGWTYISQTSQGSFIITKDSTHYGTFNSLRDAQRVRDYFREYGWCKDDLDKACESVGVTRRQR